MNKVLFPGEQKELLPGDARCIMVKYYFARITEVSNYLAIIKTLSGLIEILILRNVQVS